MVEAKREDWVRDPFKLTEEGGFFYARGAMRRQSHGRDLHGLDGPLQARGLQARAHASSSILTCGEESPNDVRRRANMLVENHRDLIDAEFALNEGAGGRIDPDDGQVHVYNGVQAGEKLYQDFTIEVTNPGGHSSRPVPDNAIYQPRRSPRQSLSRSSSPSSSTTPPPASSSAWASSRPARKART